MRRMGERREAKSPLKGMTIGLALVFIISIAVTVRSERLVEAALGTTNKEAAAKIEKDDHPTGAERDFLGTLIKQAMEVGE
tara:strand:- start:809 stop:1051 length:243 start_codon:yes stop_codon:yes gene_type:complete